MPFTFASAEKQIAEIIRREAGGHALVAGLSLGGYTAIGLSANYPDLVTALVLSGCSINFRGFSGLYLKIVSGLIKIGWLKQSHLQAEQKVRQMFPKEQSSVAEVQIQAGVFPEALGPAFAEMAGKDFTSDLRKYPGIGLILNGELDKACQKGAKKFASALSKSQIQTIPNAHHACSLEQPDAYNQAVRKFGETIC